MKEKDLLNELEKPVEQPESVEFEQDTNELGAQTPKTEQQQMPESQPNMNMLQFGQVITNTYCNISDLVYRKIKKTESAPAWQPEEKESIKTAFEGYLMTLNVPMSPLMSLVATLATCEILRYTIKPTPAKIIKEFSEHDLSNLT